MGTLLEKWSEKTPSIYSDFFKPWNDWFDTGFNGGRALSVPAANIKETKEEYKVTLAVPGMKKDDFKIAIEHNMITISCEKEEKKEEKDEKYTRKEYNYSSFSRSFTMPEEVNQEKIDAKYEDGVLKLVLPKKEEARKMTISKNISVK